MIDGGVVTLSNINIVGAQTGTSISKEFVMVASAGRIASIAILATTLSAGTALAQGDVNVYTYRETKLIQPLFDAFTKAKAPYLERLKRGEGQMPENVRYRSFLPLMDDPLPYGMKANRASIEALMTYALQQKLIPERMPLGQAFFDPEA